DFDDNHWALSVVSRDVPGRDVSISLKRGTLRANFNYDDANNVPDYVDTTASPDDPDIYEVTLKIPDDLDAGTSVMLTAPSSLVKIWTDKTKGTLLIGDGNNSHEWSVGD